MNRVMKQLWKFCGTLSRSAVGCVSKRPSATSIDLRILPEESLLKYSRICLPLVVTAVASLPLSKALAQGAPPPVPLPHPEIAKPFVTEPGIPFWLIGLSGLVLLALIGLIIWLLFRKATPPEKPPISAIKLAWDKLQDLKPLLDQLSPSEIGNRVSAILREYQENRYAVPAPRRTSEELFQDASPLLREQVRERFSPIAALYDRLSFAPQPATRDDAAKLLESALNALSEERVYAASVLPPPLPASNL